MQSFLPKCAAVGIVAGGFALTGDLGLLAERGRQLLDARTIPAHAGADAAPPPAAASPAVQAPALQPAHAVQASAGQAPAGPASAATASAAPSRPDRGDAPWGRAAAVPPPPAAGPDAIDVARLPAGTRLLVWVRRPGGPARGRGLDMIALDIIDPDSGAALEQRHAALGHGGDPAPVHAAARRVVIVRDATGRVARGGTLRVAAVHGVNGTAPAEDIGSIVAFDIPGR